MKGTQFDLDRIFRLGLFVGAVASLIWVLGILSEVLIPFLTAFLLAYLLDPLVSKIQNKIPSRGISVGLVLTGLVLVLGLTGWLVIPMILHELSHLGQLLTGLLSDSELARRASELLPNDIWAFVRRQLGSDRLHEVIQNPDALGMAQEIVRRILPQAAGLLSGSLNFLFGLMGIFVVVLYLVFMLLDFQTLKNEWENLIPVHYRDAVLRFLSDFDEAMNRYFRGQAVVAGMVGLLFALGFQILGLPLAILLGLFIGLLNMVPYLQIAGLIPAGVLAVVHALDAGSDPLVLLAWTGLVFVVVQVIQDAFLTPRIMGKVTGLSPAMILLSISVWGKLLGFFGLVIALPLTCLVLAWYKGLQARWVAADAE